MSLLNNSPVTRLYVFSTGWSLQSQGCAVIVKVKVRVSYLQQTLVIFDSQVCSALTVNEECFE